MLQVSSTRTSKIAQNDDEQDENEVRREYEFVIEKMKKLELKSHDGSNIDDLEQ